MKMFFIAVCLVCAGCAHKPVFAVPDFTALPKKHDYPDADRLVLLDETRVRYFVDPATAKLAAEVTHRQRVQQFRPGLITQVSLPYSRTFETVTSFEGQLVTPSGEVRPFKPDKKQDVSASSASVLFSDWRVILWDVPVGPENSVLEWQTVVRENDAARFAQSKLLQDDSPSKALRLVLTAPNDWDVEWAVHLAHQRIERAPRIEKGPTETTYTWESTDTPAWKEEINGASLSYAAPQVTARVKRWKVNGSEQSAFATATEMSKWMYAEYGKQSEPSSDMRDLVATLVKDLPDERARAKRLYEWVCKEVQYCAIEIGFGGWIPHAAKDVHSNRYGDCKDKANYLRALLELAGIKSHPVEIDSHKGLTRPFQMPALGVNFNHAILAIELPGETIYADPTERVVPFGQLPARDQDSTVLLLKPEGTEPTVTPVSRPQDNTSDVKLVATVHPNGEAVGTFEIELKGMSAFGLKSDILEGAEKPTKILTDWLDIDGLTVTSVDTLQAEPFAEVTRVKGSFRHRNLLVIASGASTLLRMSDIAPLSLVALADEPRQTPLIYRFMNHITFSLRLTLPAVASVQRVPPLVNLETPSFRYALKWSTFNGGLELSRTFEKRQRIVPVAEVSAVRKTNDTIHLAEADPVLIRFASGGAP